MEHFPWMVFRGDENKTVNSALELEAALDDGWRTHLDHARAAAESSVADGLIFEAHQRIKAKKRAAKADPEPPVEHPSFMEKIGFKKAKKKE